MSLIELQEVATERCNRAEARRIDPIWDQLNLDFQLIPSAQRGIQPRLARESQCFHAFNMGLNLELIRCGIRRALICGLKRALSEINC